VEENTLVEAVLYKVGVMEVEESDMGEVEN